MQVDPSQMGIVRALLIAHLPAQVRVFAFGSRAAGRARRASDLDLLLESPQPISPALLSDLRDAFDESDLPWKVDLVDRATMSEEFAQAIAVDLVPLDTE